jgi:hypothetical protein
MITITLVFKESTSNPKKQRQKYILILSNPLNVINLNLNARNLFNELEVRPFVP